MQLQKTTVNLQAVTYRDVFLQKKNTHIVGEQRPNEYLFYVNGQAKYYLQLNDETDAINKWCDERGAKFWMLVKKLIKGIDKNISGPPLMALLFDWSSTNNTQEVELFVIPIRQLWNALTPDEKQKLIK